LNSELPVIDNIYLFGAVHGMDRDFLTGRVDRILDLADLFQFRFAAFKTLSTGQQQRLALSVFFQTAGDINIFDESLSPLDQGFVRECERYFETLVELQKTVILTSHNLTLLRRFCRKALWLDHGAVRMLGSTEDVLDAYETALTSKESIPTT
jgi:lipopolysaccharide transport system ATP-binding protein